MKSFKICVGVLSVGIIVCATGCFGPPEDPLPAHNAANDSPEAKAAGAAPLIQPGVPPPGGPAKVGK